MIVGILSDSHGHCKPVRHALALFDQFGVEHIIHCGDVGGIPVFSEFVGRPFSFVWGNTDEPENGLLTFLKSVGIPIPKTIPLVLNLGGKSIAVFHGHEHGFSHAAEKGSFDYVFYGHTHEAADERFGTARAINPGALHRAKRKTIATLNTKNDELSFHEIQEK